MKWCTKCLHHRGWGNYCEECGSKLRYRTKKESKIKKFVSLKDVRCPICKGEINEKWFNFQTQNITDFIAECWSGDVDKESEHHIFRFQIEMPKVLLIHNKKKVRKK